MDKLQAKQLLVKLKIYRFCAAMFALISVLIVVHLYSKNTHGHFLVIFKDWLAITIIVAPFIPALVFTLLAKKVEAKLDKFFNEPDS